MAHIPDNAERRWHSRDEAVRDVEDSVNWMTFAAGYITAGSAVVLGSLVTNQNEYVGIGIGLVVMGGIFALLIAIYRAGERRGRGEVEDV